VRSRKTDGILEKLLNFFLSKMKSFVDSIDTELFISEVESNPAIWNTASQEYSDKVAKTNAWMNVFKKFVPDFDEKTTSDKKLLSKYCKSSFNGFKNYWYYLCRNVNLYCHFVRGDN